MTGKVWLVGAGPGDTGLMTIKGRRMLDEAEVIVYDHLVGRDILSLIPDSVLCIDVGKKAGHHPIIQEKINRILVEQALKGKRVVRLKGGDPFLFGRGGEEIEELVKYNIPFEVVPGVTSSLAVPAYNGIPVTHRDYSSSLHIITGHKKQGEEQNINYKALVEAGGTIVFLMGVTVLPEIMRKLMEAGMSPDMPAAVLQEGTTARQRRIAATVSTLGEESYKARIKPPAIIIVGEVCRLSDTISWYEDLPLMGMRVLVTRPKELISAVSEKLRRLGAEVMEVPAIETVPIMPNDRLIRSLVHIRQYEWLVFTSQAGVRIFFDEMFRQGMDVRELRDIKIAVIGSGTENALKERGIFVDLMPYTFDGESLGHTLAAKCSKETKILIPRAQKGNKELVPILEAAGAVVDDVPIYETVYKKSSCVSLKDELNQGHIDCVAFTSSSTVEGFAAVTDGVDYSNITAACIGAQTAQTAGKYGMKCFIAERASMDSLVQLIERIKKDNDKKAKKIEK